MAPLYLARDDCNQRAANKFQVTSVKATEASSTRQNVKAFDLETFSAPGMPLKWEHLGENEQGDYYYGFLAEDYHIHANLKIGMKSINGGYSSIEIEDFYFRCGTDGNAKDTAVYTGVVKFDSQGHFIGQYMINGPVAGEDFTITPGTMMAKIVSLVCPIVSSMGGTFPRR